MSAIDRLMKNAGGGQQSSSAVDRILKTSQTPATGSSSAVDRIMNKSTPVVATTTAPIETKLPFDATKTGIAVNTVLGLPKAALDTGLSILRAPGRAAASLQRTITGEDQLIPTTIPEKILYGNEPIKSLGLQNKETQGTLQDYGVGTTTSKFISPILVGGFTALDLYPGSAGKGKVIEQLAKETSEAALKSILKKNIKNITDETINTIVPQLSKTTDKKTVEQILSSTLNKKTVTPSIGTEIKPHQSVLPPVETAGITEPTTVLQKRLQELQGKEVVSNVDKNIASSNNATTDLSKLSTKKINSKVDDEIAARIDELKGTIDEQGSMQPGKISNPDFEGAAMLADIEQKLPKGLAPSDRSTFYEIAARNNRQDIVDSINKSIAPEIKKSTRIIDTSIPQKKVSSDDKFKTLLKNQKGAAGYNFEKKPLTETEKYINEQIAKQEASRTLGEARGIGQNSAKFYKTVKSKLVDFAAPIEDTLRKATKKSGISMLPEGDITNQIDRVLKTPTIAGQFIRDNGLDKVIRETPNLGHLDQYLIAKQSIAVDTRGIKTGRDIAMDTKVVKELAPTYEKDAQVVTKYSQKLLDYAVESGLIDPKIAEMLKKRYPDYVPLNRIFSEMEKSGGEFGGKAIASLSKQTVVQTLKGSERTIESPVKSILDKTADAFKQGERNKAAKIIASYEKLPGNPFGLRPLRTTADVTKRIELFSLAKDLKPIQNKVERILNSSSKELSILSGELNNLNKLGLKEYLKAKISEPLKQVSSGLETKYKLHSEADQILKDKPSIVIVKEKVTGGNLKLSESKKYIEELIQDKNIDIEAIKRKIANREPKVSALIDKIEELRNEFNSIKETRLNAIHEGRMLSDLSSSGKSTISFLDNGIKNVYEVNKDIADAAKSLNVQQLNVLGKIFATPVRIAKLGITGINLPFVASNIAKDQISAVINSKNALKTSIANPAVFLKSLLEAVSHGKVYDEMAKNGALGTSFDIARNSAPQTIEKIRAGRSVSSKIKYTITHPSELLRAAEDIIGRSEELTRIQQYTGTKQAEIAKGTLPKDAEIIASRAARENTVNFARRGEWGQVLNSAFLYLNAGIQGSRTFVRNMRTNPVQTSAKLALVVFTPVAATTAWNLSDPKRKEAYDDIADFEKQNNIIIIPPNPVKNADGTWDVIKIPLSQEVNNLSRMISRSVEAAYGENPVSVSDISSALVGSVSPIKPDVNSILSTVTPQAIKPSIEAAFNTNLFTGIPTVPASMQKLSPANQYKPYTSGTVRKIATQTNLSPLKIEAFLKGTFGGIAPQAINIIDRAASGLDIIPKDQIGGQSIVKGIVGRFAEARGGQSSQLDKTLSDIITKQADDAFRINTEAEGLYTAMSKLPKDQAKVKFEEMTKNNPLLAKAVSSVATDTKLGLNYADRMLKTLQVNNGNRALYISQELNSLKTLDEKKAKWQEYVDKKIITPQVASQISSLLNKK